MPVKLYLQKASRGPHTWPSGQSLPTCFRMEVLQRSDPAGSKDFLCFFILINKYYFILAALHGFGDFSSLTSD